MAYVGSYLWRLRQAIGSELVLMPGAMVALRRRGGQFLFAQRDDDAWCLPAGAAEPGGGCARLAVVRGPLPDLLTTGEGERVQAAFEPFAAAGWAEAAGG